jgi:hypothetical protein
MGKKSFGLIVLLVVMTIVFLLVARSWERIAPAALDIGSAGAGAVDDHGQPEAAQAARSGEMPNLRQARQSTDEHATAVRDAATAADE